MNCHKSMNLYKLIDNSNIKWFIKEYAHHMVKPILDDLENNRENSDLIMHLVNMINDVKENSLMYRRKWLKTRNLVNIESISIALPESVRHADLIACAAHDTIRDLIDKHIENYRYKLEYLAKRSLSRSLNRHVDQIVLSSNIIKKIHCTQPSCLGECDVDETCMICRVCHKKMCIQCDGIMEEDHTCDKIIIENKKLILDISKPCPRCSAPIIKRDGCNTMFCTRCKTSFDYGSLKILNGRPHNPHLNEEPIENPQALYTFFTQLHRNLSRPVLITRISMFMTGIRIARDSVIRNSHRLEDEKNKFIGKSKKREIADDKLTRTLVKNSSKTLLNIHLEHKLIGIDEKVKEILKNDDVYLDPIDVAIFFRDLAGESFKLFKIKFVDLDSLAMNPEPSAQLFNITKYFAIPF